MGCRDHAPLDILQAEYCNVHLRFETGAHLAVFLNTYVNCRCFRRCFFWNPGFSGSWTRRSVLDAIPPNKRRRKSRRDQKTLITPRRDCCTELLISFIHGCKLKAQKEERESKNSRIAGHLRFRLSDIVPDLTLIWEGVLSRKWKRIWFMSYIFK